MPRSPGVLNDEKIEALTTMTNLSEHAQAQYARILRRFEHARDIKNTRSRFFDGMTFIEDHITNENNANTYLTPRANDTEVIVNTGTSERKIDAIKNEILSVDFKARAMSYDEFDRELSETGDDMTDIAHRTYSQERDPQRDDTNMEIVDQLLTQRGVFIQETMSTRTFRRGNDVKSQPQTRVISGLKIFPGSNTISPFRWNMQPYIVIYDRYDFDTARALFSYLPNFEKVKPEGTPKQETYLGEQYDYRFGDLLNGQVEVLIYESVVDDEYQIFINGVPMFEPDQKLPWSYPGYDVQFFVNKPMNTVDWLYGRPITSMAKTLQAFSNEFLRLLVRKAQQAVEPPLGTPKSGKVYARTMWDPGAIVQGVKKDDLSKLIDHDGVSQSDFQMYNLIEQKMEEFIGTPNVAQGISGSREMSATEVLTLSKQFIKSLGVLFFARQRIERTLLEMRTYTILDNYLSPIKKRIHPETNAPFDIYRSFEIDQVKLENNQVGKKTIYMVSEDPPKDVVNKIFEFEKNQALIGNAIRVRFLNVNTLKNVVKNWKFVSYMEDKEGTSFDKIMFRDQFEQAVAISQVTQTPLNGDMVKETFERKWKAKDWFQTQVPQIPGGQAPEDEQAAQQDIKSKLSELTGMKNSGSLGSQVVEGLQGAAKGAQNAIMAQ